MQSEYGSPAFGPTPTPKPAETVIGPFIVGGFPGQHPDTLGHGIGDAVTLHDIVSLPAESGGKLRVQQATISGDFTQIVELQQGFRAIEKRAGGRTEQTCQQSQCPRIR